MKLKRFKQFILEGKIKFTQDQFDSLNRMYVAGTDDEKIIEWITKNIKSKMSPSEIFQEFVSQKGK